MLTFPVPYNPTGIFVFTDLDGTLLGHHDYAYQPVMPVIKRLQSLAIPVILNSSKTFSEMSEWLERLGLEPPFIAENGGVIYFSSTDSADKQLLGMDYARICAILAKLRLEQGFQFAGFSDLGVEGVMQATSLDRASASKAMQRAVSEPIIWLDTPSRLAMFKVCLAQQGLQLQKGGRFYHVMAHHDKANALKWVVEQSIMPVTPSESAPNGALQSNLAQGVFAQSPWVVALGDGGNDQRMLEQADLGIILPAANGENLAKTKVSLFLAKNAAPDGWSESLQTHLIKPLECYLNRTSE
ncbi:mannosyl-3-phosphoglycerate phosphatase [Thiosulfatimonas sediminis]|uniref:Mannosyl-3-phosphoglycerate phosphatase n=1 Tax=Thiosulfatimonas sediminis TaxID=2675054 RepID=A0A6F8PSD7_9GAMM|nr:HAD-IIB family hydrolase [Thiosulfatimonas sediminis]BBP44900.1 mannosyl-3-phosphoglycerate phosphatase [Thiosulfatimonas sediminis]